MKIVICCNLEIDANVFTTKLIDSGSWISCYLQKLNEEKNDSVMVICPSASLPKNQYSLDKFFSNSILRFSKENEELGRANEYLVSMFSEKLSLFKPDIVHIFGSEYPHSYSVFQACERSGLGDRVVLNLQGSVTEIAKNYYDGIPKRLIRKKTIRDIILRTSIEKQKEHYEKLAITEQLLLKSVKYVIGRTEWDYNLAIEKNKEVCYFHCTELIRDSFYDNSWNWDLCQLHSIFMSQASYPVKGLHFMLKALILIKQKYNDASLFIAGPNIFEKSWYRESSYVRYLKRFAKKHGLMKNIHFTGVLSSNEMAERLKISNVFVVCSQIENESNAFSEAMMCGTPSVCFPVGGLKSRVEFNNCAIAESGNSDSLAMCIIKVMDDPKYAQMLSYNSKHLSNMLFDNNKNYACVRDAYSQILKNSFKDNKQ